MSFGDPWGIFGSPWEVLGRAWGVIGESLGVPRGPKEGLGEPLGSLLELFLDQYGHVKSLKTTVFYSFFAI